MTQLQHGPKKVICVLRWPGRKRGIFPTFSTFPFFDLAFCATTYLCTGFSREFEKLVGILGGEGDKKSGNEKIWLGIPTHPHP